MWIMFNKKGCCNTVQIIQGFLPGTQINILYVYTLETLLFP